MGGEVRFNINLIPIDKISTKDILSGKETGKGDFRKFLLNSLEKVNELNHNADEAIEKLMTGEIKDIHQVMIAVERANLAFMTMMQIRNKLLQAYQEIMRMQF